MECLSYKNTFTGRKCVDCILSINNTGKEVDGEEKLRGIRCSGIPRWAWLGELGYTGETSRLSSNGGRALRLQFWKISEPTFIQFLLGFIINIYCFSSVPGRDTQPSSHCWRIQRLLVLLLFLFLLNPTLFFLAISLATQSSVLLLLTA